MKSALKMALCSVALIAASTTTMADESTLGAVKARQSLMQLYSFNLGGLGAMVKGKADYDAAAASAYANNLLAVINLDQSAMWPQGSDDEALPGKTRALKKIWTTYPAVNEKHKALVAGAEKMAAAAGNGLDAVKANMGAVGGGCKGCHDTYRKPKDK